MTSITKFISVADITSQTGIMTILTIIRNDKVRSGILGTCRVTIGSWLRAFQSVVLNVIER